MWFVALSNTGGSDAAVKVDVATGIATLFPLPGTNGFRPSLTQGADHNIWITNGNDSSIDRVTPSGVVTVFTTPTPDSAPSGITLGPDGNVWFIERQHFAFITPQGVVHELLNTSPEGAVFIISGSDGNLYAAGGGIDTVTQLSTAGSESSIDCPNTTYVNDLAEGPGHEIWLTLRGSAGLMKVNFATSSCSRPAGLPAGNTAAGLAKGADGHMWFADQANPAAIARYE